MVIALTVAPVAGSEGISQHPIPQWFFNDLPGHMYMVGTELDQWVCGGSFVSPHPRQSWQNFMGSEISEFVLPASICRGRYRFLLCATLLTNLH